MKIDTHLVDLIKVQEANLNIIIPDTHSAFGDLVFIFFHAVRYLILALSY